jgi:hypothetical protein
MHVAPQMGEDGLQPVGLGEQRFGFSERDRRAAVPSRAFRARDFIGEIAER